jgi:hypothetical protein
MHVPGHTSLGQYHVWFWPWRCANTEPRPKKLNQRGVACGGHPRNDRVCEKKTEREKRVGLEKVAPVPAKISTGRAPSTTHCSEITSSHTSSGSAGSSTTAACAGPAPAASTADPCLLPESPPPKSLHEAILRETRSSVRTTSREGRVNFAWSLGDHRTTRCGPTAAPAVA